MASLDSVPAAGTAPRQLALPVSTDSRGSLIAADGEDLPFIPARYFVVRDVPAGAVRAQHAQRTGQELLSCVVGACTVEVRWRGGNAVHRLADPETALHIPARVWVECREFTADAVLLALCSEPYDPLDQISDRAEFEAGSSGPA